MSLEIFLSLLLFAFTTSITPGPNNMMLLASGVNFGFRRTIPHMLGIGSGFLSLLLAVGFGLGAVLAAFPPLFLALKVAGGLYLLWIAWKIGTSRSLGEGGGTGTRPMTFLEAAAFQWVNPKACRSSGCSATPARARRRWRAIWPNTSTARSASPPSPARRRWSCAKGLRGRAPSIR
jgi:threonine/homoserine/homoserine lactone efflux protein